MGENDHVGKGHTKQYTDNTKQGHKGNSLMHEANIVKGKHFRGEAKLSARFSVRQVSMILRA